MATATEKFSVELPIDVINSINELARGKKMSISKFISSLIKKESKTEEDEKWERFHKECAKVRAFAQKEGITEKDIEDAIKSVRRKKHEDCI